MQVSHREWIFLYVLVEDIKKKLNLFNNTRVFEPNISEKPFSIASEW